MTRNAPQANETDILCFCAQLGHLDAIFIQLYQNHTQQVPKPPFWALKEGPKCHISISGPKISFFRVLATYNFDIVGWYQNVPILRRDIKYMVCVRLVASLRCY